MVHMGYLRRGKLEEWRSDPARLQSHPTLPPSKTRRAAASRAEEDADGSSCFVGDGELGLRELGNWPIQLRNLLSASAPTTVNLFLRDLVPGDRFPSFPDLQKASVAPCGRGQDEEV